MGEQLKTLKYVTSSCEILEIRRDERRNEKNTPKPKDTRAFFGDETYANLKITRPTTKDEEIQNGEGR